jgi:hypothetical protein
VCGGQTTNNCWAISPTNGLASYTGNGSPIPAGSTTTKDFTIIFSWLSTNNIPPPGSVVLKKTKTGSAFTGQYMRSFSVTPEYEVRTSTGATFTVNSGNMSVTNQTPTPSVTLSYQVQIANPVVSLTGTTKNTDGKDNILIGQGCSGTMQLRGNIPEVALDPYGYDWTVPGPIFDHFYVNPTNASEGRVISCTEYDSMIGNVNRLHQSIPRRWIWPYPITSALIKCSTNVYVNMVVGNQTSGINIGVITGSTNVKIEAPSETISGTASYTIINLTTFKGSTGYWLLAGDPIPDPMIPGCKWDGVF